MRRTVFLVPALVAGLSLVLAAPAGAAEPKLETDDQKTVYVLGTSLSRNLQAFDLSEAEIEIMVMGLREGLAGKESRVDLEVFGPKIDELEGARRNRIAVKEKVEADSFVKKAAAEKGAVTEESGLVYLETQTGSGMSPAPTDVVKVHYHGTLRDGTVFDSSVERGEPASFPLNRVIPCWTEALQKMRSGGKATITCPAEIAYGDQGQGPIKPGAALRFEVELVSIGRE